MSNPGGAIGQNREQRLSADWRESLAALPVATFDAGEAVLEQGATSGQLLILKNGTVSVTKDGIEIARVTEPGAVFGELSALLGQPHTADVRTVEHSEFHVTDANTLLNREPAALLYVATLLARRLDLAHRGLLELKNELATGGPPSLVRSTLSKIEVLLSSIGEGYVRAGAAYSISPFM